MHVLETRAMNLGQQLMEILGVMASDSTKSDRSLVQVWKSTFPINWG